MKKIHYVIIFSLVGMFISVDEVQAQSKLPVDLFIENYIGPGLQDQYKQIGTKIPDFSFDEKLNSRELKGKTLVIDFWATWCTGCLVISKGMDSLILKATDIYKEDVQLIGVNTKESMADKGYNAREFWKTTKKGYPMVDGKIADEFATSVKNGFPTVIVTDGEGIIRYRWDGAGYHTANEVMVGAWRYAIYPKIKDIPVNMNNVNSFIGKRDWVSALYFVDQLAEGENNIVQKVDILIHVSEAKARNYVSTFKEKFGKSANYDKLAKSLLKVITDANSFDVNILKSALLISEDLMKKSENMMDYQLNAIVGKLYWLYADTDRLKALRLLEMSYNLSNQNEASASEKKEIQELREKYIKESRLKY